MARKPQAVRTLTRKLGTARKLLAAGGFMGTVRYAVNRYKYHYLQWLLRAAPRSTPLSKPATVQIEVSSKCNLRCPSCSLTREVLPGRNLTLDGFKQLLARLPFRPATVSLNGIGEPLVNPAFFDIVDYLATLGIGCTFFTNGTLLTVSNRRKIIDRSNIMFVGLSCDGATPATFERLRLGANFGQWSENVASFVAAARQRTPSPVQTTLNTVLSRENCDEAMQLVELANHLGIETVSFTDVVPNDPTTAAIALSDEELLRIEPQRIIAHGAELGVRVEFTGMTLRPRPSINCFQPWEYVQISVEGDVLPCCAILGSDKAAVMGNLLTQDFGDIWHGTQFRDFRESAVRGTNSICSACPYY